MKTYEDGLREAMAACEAIRSKTITVGTTEELSAEEAAQDCVNVIGQLLRNAKAPKQAVAVAVADNEGFVNRAVAATDDGIEMFGKYTFSDKGPGAVMNVHSFANDLRDMPPVMAGELLEALAKRGATYKEVADAMKVAAVYALPFHRWVLADTVAALRAEGVQVEEVTHCPTHAHDWATDDVLVLSQLQHLRPDALLMADYPYEPFRRVAGGCPVFATRHSLAARGNTWDPEQAEADYLVSFGPWDEEMMARRNLAPRQKVLRVGVPWAGPVLTGTYRSFAECKCEMMAMTDLRPTIAWCPTWNDWSPDVAEQLASVAGVREVQVVYRPHYATAWRKPEALARARDLGFEVDDPLRHPADLLLRADVLVGDVSGIVLLALAVPGARLPIIQVEPINASGPQVEVDGPEWRWRDRVGDRVSPTRVAGAVAYELGLDGTRRTDEDLPARRSLRNVVFGASIREGGNDPARALALAMIQELKR